MPAKRATAAKRVKPKAKAEPKPKAKAERCPVCNTPATLTQTPNGTFDYVHTSGKPCAGPSAGG